MAVAYLCVCMREKKREGKERKTQAPSVGERAPRSLGGRRLGASPSERLNKELPSKERAKPDAGVTILYLRRASKRSLAQPLHPMGPEVTVTWAVPAKDPQNNPPPMGTLDLATLAHGKLQARPLCDSTGRSRPLTCFVDHVAMQGPFCDRPGRGPYVFAILPAPLQRLSVAFFQLALRRRDMRASGRPNLS